MDAEKEAVRLEGPLPSSDGHHNRADLQLLRRALVTQKWDIPQSTIDHAKQWLGQKIDPADEDVPDDLRANVVKLINEAIKTDMRAEELEFRRKEAERDRNPETPKIKRIILDREDDDE